MFITKKNICKVKYFIFDNFDSTAEIFCDEGTPYTQYIYFHYLHLFTTISSIIFLFSLKAIKKKYNVFTFYYIQVSFLDKYIG